MSLGYFSEVAKLCNKTFIENPFIYEGCIMSLYGLKRAQHMITKYLLSLGKQITVTFLLSIVRELYTFKENHVSGSQYTQPSITCYNSVGTTTQGDSGSMVEKVVT